MTRFLLFLQDILYNSKSLLKLKHSYMFDILSVDEGNTLISATARKIVLARGEWTSCFGRRVHRRQQQREVWHHVLGLSNSLLFRFPSAVNRSFFVFDLPFVVPHLPRGPFGLICASFGFITRLSHTAEAAAAPGPPCCYITTLQTLPAVNWRSVGAKRVSSFATAGVIFCVFPITPLTWMCVNNDFIRVTVWAIPGEIQQVAPHSLNQQGFIFIIFRF